MRIAGVAPTGVGQSWRLDFTCFAEGMEYEEREFVLLSGRDLMIRYLHDGSAITMIRCR